MNWKKSAIVCVSFLFAFFGEIVVNIACGGEIDPYDYYVSYFHSDVPGQEFDAFSYTSWQELYHQEDKVDEYQLNSMEWASYLKAKKEEVYQEMYDAASASTTLLDSLSKRHLKQLPKDLQHNSFLAALAKNKKALQYFVFARSCEPLVQSDFDLWNPKERDTAQMINKAQEAIGYLKEVKRDAFLRLRYAYQAVRLYHYAQNYEASKAAYEQYVAPIVSTSAVKGWAMAVYAGAVRYGGDPKRAAYLFSKVFATNPERRIQAYKNFHYIDGGAEEILPYVKSEQEKGYLFAIASFGNPEFDLEGLEKVYAYLPHSPMNGTLLGREINKLEEKLNLANGLMPNYYYTEPQNDTTKNHYLRQLELTRSFALKIASEGKYPEPELGTISAAYLSWLKNDDQTATTLLNSLEASKLQPRFEKQFRIVKLLMNARKIKQGGDFNPDVLVPELRWLDQQWKRVGNAEKEGNSGEHDNNEFIATTRNFYQQLLAPTYLKMGDTARAALLMLKGDGLDSASPVVGFSGGMSGQTVEFWQKYLGPKSLLQLENRLHRPASSGFDGILNARFLTFNRDDFYELFGTVYLRSHQYQKALNCFAKISADHQFATVTNWYEGEEIYANPFITTVNDYPKQFGDEKQAYNKRTFAKEMLRLEKAVLNDKKNAAFYYFKMANGLYQTGHFGNSWMLISYDWNSYNNLAVPQFSYDNDFKLAKTAQKYYLKARALSKDPEFRAKCTFMLAKCEQKQLLISLVNERNDNSYYRYVQEGDLYSATLRNTYFAELKQHYRNTSYLKNTVEQCSYLRDFLKRKL